MSRILIADLKKGSARLAAMLAESHELVYADTVDRVMELLEQAETFELVIVGVLFDESRMYELIKAIKSYPSLVDTPVMGFSDEHTAMSVSARNSIESGTHAMGVCDYIDTQNMRDDDIIKRIDRCLSEQRGVGRLSRTGEETPTEKREAQEDARDGRPEWNA